jgi:hypothetical protein
MTTPRNEELNAASERACKRINDEFVRQCVERHKREQAQKQHGDIKTSSAETPPRQAESAPASGK